MKLLCDPKRLLLIALFLALASCDTLNLQPQSFETRLAQSYGSITAALTSTRILLDTRKISSSDAQNVIEQADLAKRGLDLARGMYKLDPKGAEAKVSAQRAVVQGLRDYLLAKERQ